MNTNMMNAVRYAYRHSIRSGRTDFLSAFWQGMLVHDVRVEVTDAHIHAALGMATLLVLGISLVSFFNGIAPLLACCK